MAPAGKLGFTYYSLANLPRALDIVWCRFPELGIEPGPKQRPALVRAVFLNPSHTKAIVEVTYCTSRLKAFERPLDLIIANCAEMNEAGLPSNTRFDLDRTIMLPWASEFFEPRANERNIVIGHLPPDAKVQLQVLVVARRQRG